MSIKAFIWSWQQYNQVSSYQFHPLSIREVCIAFAILHSGNIWRFTVPMEATVYIVGLPLFILWYIWFFVILFINPLSTRRWSVQLTVICWKLPQTSQFILFIFQVVKSPSIRQLKTLINIKGRSKFSYLKDFLLCYRLLQKISTVYYFHKGHGVANQCWQF